jgi:hypothetical protein
MEKLFNDGAITFAKTEIHFQVITICLARQEKIRVHHRIAFMVGMSVMRAIRALSVFSGTKRVAINGRFSDKEIFYFKI